MILITGATGQLGGAATEQLIKQLSTSEFVILARDKHKAQHYTERGINVRIGDFDDEKSLDNAFKGVKKILLVPTIMAHRLEQNKRVTDISIKNNVEHIVYAGISHKNILESAVNGLDDHFKTEDYIRSAGLTYTFLRNNLYMDILPFYVGEKVFDTGKIYLPAGEGKVPFALRREMGEAAANVLLQKGHENKTYNISGNSLYSYYDVANSLSKISGKKISYIDADPEYFIEKLQQAGLDDFMISIIAGFNVDIKNGHYENPSDDLETLVGRIPTGLDTGIKEVFGL